MAYVKRNKPMDWTEAIARVLAEKGGPMSVKDITEKIIRKGYYSTASSATPQKSVNSYLSENKKGLFEKVKRGVYKLKGTPAPHATVGRGAPIVASSCPSYPLGKSVTAKVDLDRKSIVIPITPILQDMDVLIDVIKSTPVLETSKNKQSAYKKKPLFFK